MVSRTAAGGATLWSAVDLLGRQSATFVVSVVLARLLTPGDFGAVAISTFFAVFVIAGVQQGLGTAVIQRQLASDAEVSSIFWWNLIISTAGGLLLIAMADTIAAFVDLPLLKPLMVAACLQVVFTAVGAIHAARLTRELQFRALAMAGIPATILSGIIGIALATGGAGVWALAAQLVSAAALNSLGFWIVSGWRPSPILFADDLRGALRFAKGVSASGALDALFSQGIALVLGKFYGPRDVGLYTRAASTQHLPGGVIMGIISRVVLPMFASRREDRPALAQALLAANRMAMLVSLPTMVGLALTADLVVVTLFGNQWIEAGPILAILAWAGTLYPLNVNNPQLLLGTGKSNLYWRLELTKKLFGLLSMVIGSTFGIVGLAWSQVVYSIGALLISTWPSGRYLGCNLLTQLADLVPQIFIVVSMALIVLGVRGLIDFDAPIELACAAGAGMIAYGTLLFVFDIAAFKEVAATLTLIARSKLKA